MTVTQPKRTNLLPYEVCVYRTRTGDVVGWIPCAELPEWERGINISGSWTARPSLDTRFLSKQDLNGWTSEWDWSWAVAQGTHIWQAGPVKGEDYPSEEANSTTITGVGLLTLLAEKRVLVNATRSTVAAVSGIDADVAFGITDTSEKGAPIPVGNRNLALATIIKRVFQNALLEPGGDLPIDVPTADYTGTSIRGYPGYELNTPGGRALDITGVNNGPELELVPYFTTPGRKVVRHQLFVGTPANGGRLGNLAYPHVWDAGKALCRVGFSRHGEQRCNRAWEKGEGTDRNLLTGFAQNLAGVTLAPSAGLRPLLEQVGSVHTNVTDPATIQGYADTAVVNGATSTLTLSVEVRVDGDDGQGNGSRSPQLTEVSPGDTGVLNLRDHPRLLDGPYEIRILRIRGTRDPARAVLETQVLSGGFG